MALLVLVASGQSSWSLLLRGLAWKLRVFSAVFIAYVLLEKGTPSEAEQFQGLPEVVWSCLLPVLSSF